MKCNFFLRFQKGPARAVQSLFANPQKEGLRELLQHTNIDLQSGYHAHGQTSAAGCFQVTHLCFFVLISSNTSYIQP